MPRPIIVLTLAAGFAAAHGAPTAAARCSKGAELQFGPKHARMVYVLGAARPDTVLAGRGAIQYATGDGHFGRGAERPIHGQLFIVERIGTPASDSLAPAVRSVVIVPWDYGADCRPSPWSRSVRWLPPGERGLVIGNLRESRHWVDGIPTLDVHMPEAQPYPQRVTNGASTDSVLTPDELFAFLEAMPAAERFHEAPREEVLAFRDWTLANPRIAGRWPAKHAAATLRYQAEGILLRKIVPPIAGTFRFAVERPGRDSAVFFARTYPHATTSWPHARGVRRGSDTDVQPPGAYFIMAASAMLHGELPVGDADRAMDREGYLAMVHEPRVRADGVREWEGRVDLGYIERTLLADLGITDRDNASASHGVFTMDPQGRVRAEMTIGRAGGQPVVLRGERISTVSIDSKWF